MDASPELTTETHRLADGRTLAYTCSGAATGFPVIANHGTPGSRLFAALLSEAATACGVRLIVPDRPGYGRSSPPPSGWTWGDWQADLSALVESLEIDRAGVLGFSGGGPFALAAATSEWASRVALVSTVVPPAETGLATLSKIPFAVRLLFRVSSTIARIAGPNAVVQQYTARSVPTAVAQTVAADFHEALRQDARAVARENRFFERNTIEATEISTPIRAWHGTRDANTPLAPVRDLVTAVDELLETTETDHLGTLLDHHMDVFEWLSRG